ncbi:hypothetical protein AB0M68_34895 [Streptomyces sp. NPDC051453]|uniref:hypothetical protein n=1 Tax=Streptomyces sp. NPDC051453 TaxID=3154941 RepID=UPI00342AF45C
MVNVQVRGESGTVEARAKHGVAWGPGLAALDQSEFPMLGHLPPCADTVFNSRRVVTLLAEVSRLPPGVVTDVFSREFLDLCQTVLDGQHRHLWFLGD